MEISEKAPAYNYTLSQSERRLLITTGLVLGDILAISLAFGLAYWLRFQVLPYWASYQPEAYLSMVLWVVPAWIVIFALLQLYNPRMLFGGLQEYANAFTGVSLGIVFILLLLFFFLKEDIIISRGWLALTWLIAVPSLIGMRFTLRRTVYALRRRGYLLSPALIVGANDEGRVLADQLHNWTTSGLFVVGFVDPNQPSGTPVCNGYRVLGSLDDLEALARAGQVEEVIVAPSALNREQLVGLFRLIGVLPQVHLRMSSGLFEIMTTGLRVQELAYVPLIEVNRFRYTGVHAFLKGLVDYGVTLLALLLAWPFMVLIAALVKLDSPGPAIYRRRVMGVNGKQFDAFKFRTMRLNGDQILAAHPELQEELRRTYKLREDPRVTRLGRLLRKYSIDELPQLINVLSGQMSLVGPRMISPPEMAEYGKWGMNLLTVKPGITGFWQVKGRSDVSYEERVRLDMQYIRNWSLLLDLYILVSTPLAVIQKKGAY